MKNKYLNKQAIPTQGSERYNQLNKQYSYKRTKLIIDSQLNNNINNVSEQDLIKIKESLLISEIEHCQQLQGDAFNSQIIVFNEPIGKRLIKNIVIFQKMRTTLNQEHDPRSLANQQHDQMQQIQERKGRFTPQQQKQITNAVGQFLATNEISFDDFLLLLNQKNVINTVLRRSNFFNFIAKQLPGRSSFSCYRFVKRVFNPNNKKRPWKLEEQAQLLELVKDNGHQWTVIGKFLGRSADSVYDKYRSLGCQNAQKRIKSEWQLKQYVKLLLEVNSRTNFKFLDQKIISELSNENVYNIQERISNRQNKYNTQNDPKPLLQMAAKYLNENIRRINIQGIAWSIISSKLKRKSMIDCKNKFMQLFQFAGRSFPFDDLKIIEFIIAQKIEQEHQIVWNTWLAEQITETEAKNRLLILKRTVKNKSVKRFMQVIMELKQRLLKKKNTI